VTKLSHVNDKAYSKRSAGMQWFVLVRDQKCLLFVLWAETVETLNSVIVICELFQSA